MRNAKTKFLVPNFLKDTSIILVKCQVHSKMLPLFKMLFSDRNPNDVLCFAV